MNSWSMAIRLAYGLALLASTCGCSGPEPIVHNQATVTSPGIETIRPPTDSRFYEQMLASPANAAFLERAGLQSGRVLERIHLVSEEALVFNTARGRITLYAGCRVHECDSKAYLAADSAGRIVVAAIQTPIFCSRDTAGPCSNGRPFVHVAVRDLGPQVLRLLMDRIEAQCRSSSTIEGGCGIYLLRVRPTNS